MTRTNRGLQELVGRVVSLTVAASLALGLAGAPQPASAADPALPAWNGGIDLYRDGTFTTQQNWLWCTAAGIQIMRNIVDDQEDHSTSGQRRYFNWMREHNRYTLPLAAGVDPARLSYGSTIKKQRDIAWAYEHGVRLFAIDSEAELRKVAEAAPGSTVFCRITSDGSGADWPLTRKFGCDPEMALDSLAPCQM